MAITIQHNPSTYFSVHDDVIFTVVDIVKASDPVTYPDYRYICDVYVGSELVTQLKSYPNPTNKIGVFNVGNILRNYIAANFNPTGSAIRAQEMGNEEYSITATMKFGEEYNFTTYTNLTVDSARTYFNHYNGRMLGVNTNLTGYLNCPLTTRPVHTVITPLNVGTQVYENNKNNFVPFLPTDTSTVTLIIKSYTDAGALVTTQNHAVAPSAGNTLQLYNLSPTVLNTVYPGVIPLGVASYYTVEFSTPVIATDRVMRFNLVCEPKYEVFTVHFLNKFGGFESRDFTKVSRKVLDIERSEFGRLGWEMDSSGVVTYKNSNNVYNDKRTVFSTQYTEKMTLNTDILTDNEYTWMADLILSPMVYIELKDDGGTVYFVPCVISENNYEFRKRINDKLTNLTIKVEFGDQFNSQFR